MTREQTREAAAVMLGWADGKVTQYRSEYSDVWIDAKEDENLLWDWTRFIYRLKPIATLRPWTADEVPLGAITRIKHSVNPSNPSRQIIDGENGVMAFLCGCPWSLEDLLRMREHSTDGGLNWKPCGVEEVKP